MYPTYFPVVFAPPQCFSLPHMPRTDLPAHLITLGNDNSPVCRHFLAGRCERGSACKFSHDLTRGAPTERHRLTDVVRLLSVAALESILHGRDAIGDTLREECADRYIAKITPAPCIPHPTVINQRVKMYELHIQERRGYSVRNPRPRRSLEEVLGDWDAKLADQRYCMLPKDIKPSTGGTTGEGGDAHLIGRSPSYGSVKVSLHAWAHLCSVYTCECFLDLLRRELRRSHFFDDDEGGRKTGGGFEHFARAAHVVLTEQMLPTRYAEHAPPRPTPPNRRGGGGGAGGGVGGHPTNPTPPQTFSNSTVLHHPETFLDVLRLAFPQLLVCRTFPPPTAHRGAEVRLIAAGKSAQLEAFFDRVAEYVWVVERRGIHPRVHGLRSDSDGQFDAKVRRHAVPCLTALDGMPPPWKAAVHATWKEILRAQFVAFTQGVAEGEHRRGGNGSAGAGGDGGALRAASHVDAEAMPSTTGPPPPPSPHRREGGGRRRHAPATPHGAPTAGMWEEWHAADANREANPEDNPPDARGARNSSGEESEALERQREQLLELMADSD